MINKETVKNMLIDLKNHLYSHTDEYLVIQNHSSIDDNLLNEELDYELDVNMINLLLDALED